MILALHTATPILGVALMREDTGAIEALWQADVGNGHAEALFVALDAACRAARALPSDIRAVGAAVGPGGFTGVRSGIAFAKAFARARGVPLYGLDTLTADAYEAQLSGASGRVSPMLDGRRGLVFAALYALAPYAAEPPQAIAAPALLSAEAWAAALAEGPAGTLALGEGATAHRERFEAAGCRVAPASAHGAGLRAIAEHARLRFRAAAPDEAAGLAPLYLREPQAVLSWEARQAAR